MKNNFLNITGAEILSKAQQKTIIGQASIDLSKCGCSCSGSVTGPAYCITQIACLQVYTCKDQI